MTPALPPSPYKRGAHDGLTFGLLLIIIGAASALSFRWPLLGLLSVAGVVSVPPVIYFYLRRSYIEDHGTTLLSSLWMQGIMIFACGSSLAGVAGIVYLKWINPHFIAERVAEAIEFYRSANMAAGDRLADTLQSIVDARMMPSAVQIVVEMIWLAIFSGSLLSVLMALLVRARRVNVNQ